MRTRIGIGIAVLALLTFMAILPQQARADGFDVFVGYADGLRGAGFFPDPWAGGPGVTNFLGRVLAGGYDDGAIRIDNTSGASLVINKVEVNINGTAVPDPWGPFGLFPFTIPDGGKAILTGTVSFNFDTSDIHPIIGCGGTLPPGSISPKVVVTANGVPTSFDDSGHVLDTGGFDFACLGLNESHAWRPIGTFGGPAGGEIPEPATLFLLGSGLTGLAILRRRKDSSSK